MMGMGGSSGEQEEESSSGIMMAGSGMNFSTQYGGGVMSAGGYERGRNQQTASNSRLGQHMQLEQSHGTPTRNVRYIDID
jgi:hypothetical protein